MITWIQNNMDGLIVGVITGIVVLIIGWFANKCLLYYNTRSSKYSGKWIQSIYTKADFSGTPIKQDIYNIKHKKTNYSGKLIINIEGTISRSYPKIQSHRKWDIIGYLDGDILTILYQAQEGQKSRGCIYAKLYTDFEFRGYYLEEHKDGTIDKTPVIIKKDQKEWRTLK